MGGYRPNPALDLQAPQALAVDAPALHVKPLQVVQPTNREQQADQEQNPAREDTSRKPAEESERAEAAERRATGQDDCLGSEQYRPGAPKKALHQLSEKPALAAGREAVLTPAPADTMMVLRESSTTRRL